MNFPVLFIFIAFALCNVCKSEDEMKTVIEGDSVQLNFPYLFNSTRLTLQYRNREPFYRLTDTESIVLPPEQVHRFTFKSKSDYDHCSLQVRISPVMRIDAGTYIFFAYSEEGIYEGYFKRIGLDVDLVPGKASCTLDEEQYMVGNWVTLNCMALVESLSVESLSDQIECYQNGERMPSRTTPTEINRRYLKQTILVQKKHPVFCCTSTWEHTKDLCDCNDFQWDLANDKNLSSIIDPCGPTTSAQDLIETNESTFSPSKPISTTTIKINSHNGSVPKKYVVVFCLGSILITGLVILVIVLMLKSRKSKEKFLKYVIKFKSSSDQSPPEHQVMVK